MMQRTIDREITFDGVGLHSGRQCTVTLRPAPADTGITFFRTDRGEIIRLSPYSVVDTSFATTIGHNGTRIKTIEHLMAVLSAFEIDNLYIDVNGPEIPALDGSSRDIAKIVLEAGFVEQASPKRVIEITRPVSIEDGKAKITALPFRGRRFSQTIEFSNHFLGRQEFSMELTPETFISEVSPARTFGFLKDVEMLRQHGLARGGSLENAVIIDDNGVLNPSGTRFPDEFVRHKTLDCIGDMYLCGIQIHGHIIAERSGHTTNVKFLKKLFSSRDSFRLIPEKSAHECMASTVVEQNLN